MAQYLVVVKQKKIESKKAVLLINRIQDVEVFRQLLNHRHVVRDVVLDKLDNIPFNIGNVLQSAGQLP